MAVAVVVAAGILVAIAGVAIDDATFLSVQKGFTDPTGSNGGGFRQRRHRGRRRFICIITHVRGRSGQYP